MLYLPIVALLLGKALHTSAYPQAWGFGCDHIGNACSDEDTSTPELFYDGHCQNGIDDNDGTKTIYQALSEDPKFSRLVKIINFADGEIVELLNDGAADVTFFAVPNFALKPHGERLRDTLDNVMAFGDDLSGDFQQHDLPHLFLALEALEATTDDPDKDRRKEILKKIITAILKYHIIPQSLDAQTLAKNHTYPTKLTLPDTSSDPRPQRLRVGSSFLPLLRVNFFSRVIKPDLRATNGIVHVLNHPLLPPLAVFQELFIIPDVFSFATTALQRVDLTKSLDLRWIHGKGDEKGKHEGTSAVTFFAPTKRAFKSLPRKLQLFLFSPFGERALKKLLQYHIVPDAVVFSDYIRGAKATVSENQDACDALDPGASYTEFLWASRRGLSFEDDEESMFLPRAGMWEDTDIVDGGRFASWDALSLYPPEQAEPSCCISEDTTLRADEEGARDLFDWGVEDEQTDFHFTEPSAPYRPQDGQDGFLLHQTQDRDYPTDDSDFCLGFASGGCGHLAPASDHCESVFHLDLNLPTLLPDHSLPVRIDQAKCRPLFPIPKRPVRFVYVTTITAKGQKVALPDVVARNGAVHLVSKLLNPRKISSMQDGEDDGWDDWESWLPQWGEM